MSVSSRIALKAGLTAVTASLVLVGCSAADQADTSANDTSNDAATAANGSQGGSITIMTHDSFNISEELLEQFEEESGYSVTTTSPGDAGAVVAQLLLQKDNPTVDGFYGVDNYSAPTLLDADMLAEYTGELPAGAEDLLANDSHQLVPIDQGQVCVNADLAWFEENNLELPETLEDLADPAYENLFVTTDPNDSSPGLAFMVATFTEFGDEAAEYWEKLFAQGTRVASGWSDAYYTDFSATEGGGDYPLVTSYSSSPSAEGGATTSIDGTCTPQIEYAGVLKDSENADGVQAFIEFMLAEDFQNDVITEMYMYPVNQDVELPEEWAQYATLAEDPIEPELSDVAENRDDWLNTWTELFQASAQ